MRLKEVTMGNKKGYIQMPGYCNRIQAGNLSLELKTSVEYWEGNGNLKLEDLPGTFMDISLRVIGGNKDLFPLESLAVKHRVVVWKPNRREITDEPEGYAELYHKSVLKKVRDCVKKDPSHYTKYLGGVVKQYL